MKKILGIMAAGALLFGFAGQSMASVNLGDLIQVIYENPSVGSTEVVTDLGSVTSDILLSNKTIGSSVITSDFSGVSLSNLTVAYFALSSTSGSSTSAWISGSPSVTEETYATHKGANLTNGWALFSGQYSGAGSTFVGSEGSTGSYYAVYTANSAGSMAGFLKTGNAETTLGSAPVTQTLYYWPTANALSTFGSDSATLETNADGTVTINPGSGSSVPIPPSMLLLAPGLLGLIGLRRKSAQ